MSGSAALRLAFSAPSALARLLPFGGFVVAMAVEPWLARQLEGSFDTRWLYGLRVGAAGGLLLACWPLYAELRGRLWSGWGEALRAAGCGLAVLAVWLTLDGGIFVLGAGGGGFDPRAGDGSIDWPLALLRLVGAALVVPVMEELFWRSFLLRWLERRDWAAGAPALIGWRSLLLGSAAFGFEHDLWAAGIVAGLVYGWLYRQRGNLWDAIVAHAVTNAGLGAWVLATGTWRFW